MSYLVAVPEMFASAAGDLERIGSALTAANGAALAPTTGLLAAGADEISGGVAVFRPCAGLSGDQRPGRRVSSAVSAGVRRRRECLCGRRGGQRLTVGDPGARVVGGDQ